MATQGLSAAPDMMLGMTRSMMTMMEFNEQKQDYTDSLANLEEGSEAYAKAIEACHRRGAVRCRKIAQLHRGLYVKAAQFISSLRGGTGDKGIPGVYIEELSVFTDHAPHKGIKDVAPVLKEFLELGAWPEEGAALPEACPFKSFEVEPMASASLAQVHRAVLKDGRNVAVKIQYPELQKEMASDFSVFKSMGAQISSMAQGYDVMWIVDDFEKYLTRELDFRLEAENAAETARLLAHLQPAVIVPPVLKEFSSDKVVTMEFCEGLLKANDPEGLENAGLDPFECADLICSTFSEMIFLHGRVHADPHAGNIYIRPREDQCGRRRPQLVILDHGLYHDLSENDVRQHFCKYWMACCSKDRQVMEDVGKRFAGALRRFLPMILSPWFALSGAGATISDAVAASRGQLPDTVGLRDVADFVCATREGGANLIGLLHALGYVRGLLNALRYPERRRLEVMLGYALRGDCKAPPQQSRPLTMRESLWASCQLALFSTQVHLAAPIAVPLLWLAGARGGAGAESAAGAAGAEGGAEGEEGSERPKKRPKRSPSSPPPLWLAGAVLAAAPAVLAALGFGARYSFAHYRQRQAALMG